MDNVNDSTDEFDRALERIAASRGRLPPDGAVDAAVEAHEALRLAWASLRSVCGDAVSPTDAVAWADAVLRHWARSAARQAQDTTKRE